MSRFKAPAMMALLALVLFAPASVHAAPAAQPPASLSPESLANATYAIDYVPGSPITLTNGVYENAADHVSVRLLPKVAYGDMTGDGADDAAVLIASNTGGSGVFVELILMTEDGDQAVQMASTLLGDRVNVKELAIENQTIVVTMVQQGPDDPMCCPSQQVTQTYVVDGSELVLQSEEAAEPTTSELTDEALENASYDSEYVEGGIVTLENGVYESAPPEGESGPRVSIPLASDWNTYGDLNNDGVDDAAVILVSNSGGSGVYHDLAAVLNVDGEPQHVASAYLGDRVIINSLAISDSAILVDMVQQGPDEPMCCPTQHTVRTYRLDDSGLVLVSEAYPDEASANVEPAAKESFDPTAEPNTATLNAGAAETGALDPSIVGVISGVADGSHYAAAQLGAACAGVIPSVPDVVVNWAPAEGIQKLRFFTLSTGDPTLVVATPDGTILCNDDLNPLNLDALVQVDEPQAGRYAVFVGALNDKAAVPALLVVTSQETDPASFDVNALVPRPTRVAASGRILPAGTLRAAGEASAEVIRGGDTPFTREVEAGGPVGAFEVDLGNELCTGFVSAEPSLRFRWLANASQLGIYFEGDQDTTLIVRDPAGAFQCADDAAGAHNLNPHLLLPATPGRYDVWVGSSAPDITVPGILTITSDAEATPTPLTADMMEGEQ